MVYGGPGLTETIDLSNLSAAQGFTIQGDATGDEAGYSVSSAGDVNGDGYDDLIVGAPFGADGGRDAGEAYIVFGGPGLTGTIDLSTLSQAQGFIIQGDVAGNQAGVSVSSAGDINGDGFDDVIVGAYGYDYDPDNRYSGNYYLSTGEAYVIYGGATGIEDTTNVSTVGTAAGIISPAMRAMMSSRILD